MSNTKIYIDQQISHRRIKPYRLRVMKGTCEAVSIYFAALSDAKRARSFARKLITGLEKESDSDIS